MADLYHTVVDLLWHEIALMLGRLSILAIALIVVVLIVGPGLDRLARRRRPALRLHDHHPLIDPHDRKDTRP